MTTPRIVSQEEYQRADRAHEAAEALAKTLPGFPAALATSTATLPELDSAGRRTWEVQTEAADWTAAAMIRVTEQADGRMVAELVERYTHSIGTPDDIGDDYFVDQAGAERAAVERSQQRSETVAVWDLTNGVQPAALVVDGTIYRPAA